MLFDGKAFAKEKEIVLKFRVKELEKKGIVPKLVSILADNSLESALYVSLKEKFAQRIGVIFEVHRFGIEVGKEEIIADIKKANQDEKVQGVMVQLPLPNQEEILPVISPLKDVDCLTAENLGLIAVGRPRFLPATVRAVIEIIRSLRLCLPAGRLKVQSFEEKWLRGVDVCIVGASIIVGKPLAILLSDAGATVTLCRSTTENLPEYTRRADILVSATGAAELIRSQMVKDQAVVIDVGISKLLREGRYKVVGDVSSEVLTKAAFVTPVPGGVGPVTVACLFENLVEAIEKKF